MLLDQKRFDEALVVSRQELALAELRGTYTAVYGMCTVNGQTCQESSFVQTGKCP
jgi:hypothetical protein